MSDILLKENEVKEIMVDILDEIKEYCRSEGMEYFLICGTLLGAVRHKGFIPWDDDIDIALFREDYEKLIKNFKSKSGKVKILSMYLDDGYNYMFSKAIDDTTIVIENDNDEKSIGVFVDIFPIDSLCDDKEECKKIIMKISYWQIVHQLKYIRVRRDRSWLKNLLLILSRPILKLIPDRFFFNKVNKIIGKYKKNDKSKYVANVFGAWGEREVTLRENFSSSAELEFEGKQFSVPTGYDKYLTDLYGDYMELPPEEKRVTHHDYVAYRKS